MIIEPILIFLSSVMTYNHADTIKIKEKEPVKTGVITVSESTSVLLYFRGGWDGN